MYNSNDLKKQIALLGWEKKQQFDANRNNLSVMIGGAYYQKAIDDILKLIASAEKENDNEKPIVVYLGADQLDFS